MKDNLDEKIKKSYDAVQMSEESRERILGNLLSAADSAGAEDAGRRAAEVRPMRRRLRHVAGIAVALVGLLAFGGVAYANGWFGLGLKEYVPEPVTVTYAVTQTNDEGEKVVVAEYAREYRGLSLAGAAGSPEQLGQTEWSVWKSKYIREAPSNGVQLPCTEIPADYIDKVYGAFNDDMKAKLAGICEKYGLKLHPDEQDVSSYEDLCRRLGYKPLKEMDLDRDVFAAVDYTDGAYYFDFVDRSEGLNIWMHYNLTGVLHDVGGFSADPEDYTERIITTEDGVQIIVAEGKGEGDTNRTVIVIPLDRGQITVTAFYQSRVEDTSVRESSKDRYRTIETPIPEEELQKLIGDINIPAMGSQTEEVLERNISIAEQYQTAAQPEYASEDGEDLARLDTTLQDASPEIEELMKKYYKAMLEGDPETEKSIYQYPDVLDDRDIIEDAEYIEELEVRKVHMIATAKTGEWMAFTNYDIKYTGLDPVLPNLGAAYITTAEDGSLKMIPLSARMRMYLEGDRSGIEKLGMLQVAEETNPELIKMVEEHKQAREDARDNDPAFDEFMTFWTTRGSYARGTRRTPE